MADTIIKHVSAENLKQYDGLIKQYLEAKDAAVKAALEGQIDIVAQAITAEESRAKLAEQANATAAQNAQAKGEEALAHSEALAGKVGEVPTDKTVVGMIEDVIASAYDDSELRGLISELDTNKADKTQVATDIAAAVKVEEDARKEAVAGVQGEVDALEQTVAGNKSALEGAIALKADQTALDAVSGVANAAVKQSDYNVKVKALEDEDARIAGLVATEAERADAAEKANAAAIKAISDDYLKKADKEELQGNIDDVAEALELLTNGVSAEEVDGVNDLIQYVNEHGTEVTGIKADIKANADAISEHVAIDHNFAAADTALKNELNGEIAKKANQTALDEAVEALEGADAAQIERIAELEGKVGSSNVAGDIAAAEQRAKDAAAEDATNKANAAETAAKGHADSLNTAMNTRVEALEAIDHEHANKAELDLIASGDKAKWDAAAAKTHEHANSAELNKIADGDVAKWNAAEQNAKDFATGLNTAMTARVDGIVETVGTKAAQADLNAATGRITTAEGEIDQLQSDLDAVEATLEAMEFMSQEDINNLFA